MSKWVSLERLQYFKNKLDALLANKVDKVSGKGLSTNDYDNTEKAAVAGAIKGLSVDGTTITITKNDNTTSAITTQDTTYSAFTGATSSAAGAAGLVPAPTVDDRTKFLQGNGEWATVAQENTTYTLSGALNGNAFVNTLTPSTGSATTSTVPAMVAAGASAAGKAGLVPAPGSGKNLSFLRGDGTWVVPTDTTYDPVVASTSGQGGTNGLMTAADKEKLDAFGAASTYALKSDISGVYKYKGSVATVDALPSSGQTVGDVYDVQARGINYAWNGTAWDPLGELFQIDEITTAEIDAMFAAA